MIPADFFDAFDSERMLKKQRRMSFNTLIQEYVDGGAPIIRGGVKAGRCGDTAIPWTVVDGRSDSSTRHDALELPYFEGYICPACHEKSIECTSYGDHWLCEECAPQEEEV